MLTVRSRIFRRWTLVSVLVSCFVFIYGLYSVANASDSERCSLNLYDNLSLPSQVSYADASMEKCDISVFRQLKRDSTVQVLSLPFSLSRENLESADNPLYGAVVRRFVAARHLVHNGRDSVVITLEKVDSIIAGFPYFLHWVGGDGLVVDRLDFKDVTLEKIESLESGIYASSSASCYANLSPIDLTSLSDQSLCLLINDDGDIMPVSVRESGDADQSLRGFRSYILLSDSFRSCISDGATFHIGDINDFYISFTAVDSYARLLINKTGRPDQIYLQYSMGDDWWRDYDFGYIDLSKKGQRVYFRAKYDNYICGGMNSFYSFVIEGAVSSSGSVMSLIYVNPEMTVIEKDGAFMNLFRDCNSLITPPELPALTLKSSCYQDMFAGCSSLLSTPELPAKKMLLSCYYRMFDGCQSIVRGPELPATELAYSCYGYMFRGCRSLQYAPELKETNLKDLCYTYMFASCSALSQSPSLPSLKMADKCYEGMFSGCISLESPPELPAIQLASGCYSAMFRGCTSLQKAPVLPAMDLKTNCYYEMFKECRSLTVCPELPAKILTDQCYSYMFQSCTSLITPPILSSTCLYTKCYYGMFESCTSLVYPPDLPADVLYSNCYNQMFKNCISLTRSPIMYATILAYDACSHMFENCVSLDTIIVTFNQWQSNSTIHWVDNVASSGCFIAPCVLPRRYGIENIPPNWSFFCQIDLYDNKDLCDTLVCLDHTKLQANMHTKVVKSSVPRPMSLPFDLSAEELRDADNPLYGAKIQTLYTTYIKKSRKNEDSVLFILEDTDSIIAGYPFFISWEDVAKDTSEVLIFKDVLFSGNCSSIVAIKPDSTCSIYANFHPISYKSFSSDDVSHVVIPQDDGILQPLSAISLEDTLFGYRNYFVVSDDIYRKIESGQPGFRYGGVTDYALCFKALEANSVVQLDSICTFNFGNACAPIQLLYSIDDGISWETYTWKPDDGKGKTIILKNINDRVYFVAKDSIEKFYYTFFENGYRFNICYRFVTNGRMEVSGDIMSLLDHRAQVSIVRDSAFYRLFYNCGSIITPPDLPAISLSSYCYANMFENCVSLQFAPELPATILSEGCYRSMFEGCLTLSGSTGDLLASDLPSYCYSSMFKGCESLKRSPYIGGRNLFAFSCAEMFSGCLSLPIVQDTLRFININDSFACYRMFASCKNLSYVPELPGCKLSKACYLEMFMGCSSLGRAPNLPSELLVSRCYERMFASCVSMTTIQLLPATILVDRCYRQMFLGCSLLDTIRVSFDSWSPSSSTQQWVEDIHSSGVFIAPCGLPNIQDVDHVPFHWLFRCNLELYDSINPKKDIANFLDSTVNVTIHTNLSKNGEIRTLTLPFDISASELRKSDNPLYGVTVQKYLTTYVFKASDGHDSVVFVLETVDSIIAGKPYFVHWKNSRNEVINPLIFKDVTLVKDSSTDRDDDFDDMVSVCPNLSPLLCRDIYQHRQGSVVYLVEDNFWSLINHCDNISDSLYGFRSYFVLSNKLSDSLANSPSFHFSELPLPFLHFIAQEDCCIISLRSSGEVMPISLSYSFSGSSWFPYVPNSPISLYQHGDGVYFAATGYNRNFSTQYGEYFFDMNKPVKVEGNIMSLLDRTVRQHYVPDYGFRNLFSSCKYLLNAPELSADSIGIEAYAGMFSGCVSLYEAPELPVLKLSYGCYNGMFDGCESLRRVPDLPSLFLAPKCYESMFASCTSLIAAPKLPAKVLAEGCYSKMFKNCLGLIEPPVLSASVAYPCCYEQMFDNCQSLKSFPSMSISKLAEGCFRYMFSNCRSVISVPSNYLPVEELSFECYRGMFSGCSSLNVAPRLPSKNLADRCYQSMFSGCLSLSTAPLLPATIMMRECYDSMFYNCSSLTNLGLSLPATTLADHCYSYMFGDCSSLLSPVRLPALNLHPGCYKGMFANCSSIVFLDDEDYLPALSLASECYAYMFQGCISLKTPPQLKADSLSESCYRGMFTDCSSLVVAPRLPSVNLAENCYAEMFSGCKNLVEVDTLCALTLQRGCYRNMFSGCSSLDSLIVMFKDWFFRYTDEESFSPIYTENWLSDVSQEGTVIAPCELLDRHGVSFIPDKWVKDDILISVSDTASPKNTLSQLKWCTDKLQINRIFYRNGNFNTVCLPFDCSLDQLRDPSHPFYLSEVFQFNDSRVVGDTLVLELIPTNHIYAGFPYFIRWDGRKDPLVNPIFSDIEIKLDRVEEGYSWSDKSGGMTMYSTFAPLSLLDCKGDVLVFDNGESDYHLITGNNSYLLRGFRGYIVSQYLRISKWNVRLDINTSSDPILDGLTLIHQNPNNSVTKRLIKDRLVIIRHKMRYDVLGRLIRW